MPPAKIPWLPKKDPNLQNWDEKTDEWAVRIAMNEEIIDHTQCLTRDNAKTYVDRMTTDIIDDYDIMGFLATTSKENLPRRLHEHARQHQQEFVESGVIVNTPRSQRELREMANMQQLLDNANNDLNEANTQITSLQNEKQSFQLG